MFGKSQLLKNIMDFCNKNISSLKLPIELTVLTLSYLQEVDIKYFENGQKEEEKQILNEKIHGYNIKWYPNFKLRHIWLYMYGEKNGEIKGYYNNGQIDYIHNYKNGKKIDCFRGWYSDGKKAYSYFYNKKNLKHGKFEYWYTNGEKEYIINYKNGVRHGKDIYWDDSGNIEAIIMNSNGNRNGICIYYDSCTGDIKKRTYKHGTLMGTIYSNIQYDNYYIWKNNRELY